MKDFYVKLSDNDIIAKAQIEAFRPLISDWGGVDNFTSNNILAGDCDRSIKFMPDTKNWYYNNCYTDFIPIDEALAMLEKKEDEYKAGDWVKLSSNGGQFSTHSDRKLPDGYAHLLVEYKSCPLNTPLLVIGEQFLAETRCLILTDTVHAYHVTYNATISSCGVKYKYLFSSVTDKEVEAHLIMTIKEEIVNYG